MEDITVGDTKKITAFVSYAWDTEAYNDKIIEFIAFLHNNGIDADCDKTIMENRTDPNLNQVMHDGLTRDKVIVVLSKKYKEKANCENTGVNKEYNVIATQRNFEENKNKFIFVTFQGTSQKDIEEIVPIMFLGNEILDLSKMDDNVKNRLFAKLRDEKTIELPPVADGMPDIKKKVYTGTFEENKHIFCFQISEDRSLVTYNDETKNSLRKWIGSATEEYEIRIEDLHIKALHEWVDKKDAEIAAGKFLSEEDEKNYIFISQAIENSRKKDKIAKLAIRTFLEKLSPEMSVYSLTVNDYLKVIEKIFMDFILVNRKDGYANVEGWCMGDNNFVLKAEVKDINYRESTKMLYCRDARIGDFSRQDIVEGIVPALCGYYAIGKSQNREYAIEKKKNWLLSLQFGLA